MRQLYPPIEPAHSGYLETGDGHAVYFEDCGARDGLPVVFLHGGPGSSCNANHRRYFDPARYRIVLFDQRGCGRSRPRGGVANNTTADLVSDMERLRLHLGVDRWMLFGGSWGSTLALAYAAAHSERVLGLVLRGVFLATHDELRWYCEGLRSFVPEAWMQLTAGVVPPTTDRILAHYANGLASMQAAATAQSWNSYESRVMAIGESGGGTAADTPALLDRARVQLHYLVSGCFLPVPLRVACAHLRLPAIIVQGRRDLICPPVTAHELHRLLAGSELVMVEEGGHSAMHPAMIDALVGATDRMVVRLRERAT